MENINKEIRSDVNSLDCAINLLLENLEETSMDCEIDQTLLDQVYEIQSEIDKMQGSKNTFPFIGGDIKRLQKENKELTFLINHLNN